MIKNIYLVGNKFHELSDDITYLKDVNFFDEAIRYDLINLSQLSSRLGSKQGNDYKEDWKNLESEIEVNIFNKILFECRP